jgi:hypothetical protein
VVPTERNLGQHRRRRGPWGPSCNLSSHGRAPRNTIDCARLSCKVPSSRAKILAGPATLVIPARAEGAPSIARVCCAKCRPCQPRSLRARLHLSTLIVPVWPAGTIPLAGLCRAKSVLAREDPCGPSYTCHPSPGRGRTIDCARLLCKVSSVRAEIVESAATLWSASGRTEQDGEAAITVPSTRIPQPATPTVSPPGYAQPASACRLR